MYQAHRDPIRGLRWDILRTAVADGVSAAMLDIQACFLVLRRLVTTQFVIDWCFAASEIAVLMLVISLIVVNLSCWPVTCLQRLTLLRDSIGSVVAMLSLKAVFNKTGLVFQKRETYPIKTNNSVS